jgi:hypothetical protein
MIERTEKLQNPGRRVFGLRSLVTASAVAAEAAFGGNRSAVAAASSAEQAAPIETEKVAAEIPPFELTQDHYSMIEVSELKGQKVASLYTLDGKIQFRLPPIGLEMMQASEMPFIVIPQTTEAVEVAVGEYGWKTTETQYLAALSIPISIEESGEVNNIYRQLSQSWWQGKGFAPDFVHVTPGSKAHRDISEQNGLELVLEKELLAAATFYPVLNDEGHPVGTTTVAGTELTYYLRKGQLVGVNTIRENLKPGRIFKADSFNFWIKALDEGREVNGYLSFQTVVEAMIPYIYK